MSESENKNSKFYTPTEEIKLFFHYVEYSYRLRGEQMPPLTERMMSHYDYALYKFLCHLVVVDENKKRKERGEEPIDMVKFGEINFDEERKKEEEDENFVRVQFTDEKPVAEKEEKVEETKEETVEDGIERLNTSDDVMLL